MTTARQKPARPAVAVAVPGCVDCPFAHSGEETCIDNEPWSCTAAEVRGRYRNLNRSDVWGPRGRELPPPSWCPLRKGDRLVTLQTRSPR